MLKQAVTVFAIALLSVSQANAQVWPSKPLRIIMETGPGSVFDTAFRALAPALGAQLGQPVVIENRPGASGMVALEACVKAPHDGYTACAMSTNGYSFTPHLFSKVPYDPERDFKPVSNVVLMIDGLVSSAVVPVKSLAELQTLAVSKAGGLNFGTLGEGSATDFFRQVLGEQWKTTLVGIPYKGGANLTAAGLMSGEIDLSWGSMGSWIGGINAGKIRLHAVASSRRLAQFPAIPTFDEIKLSGIGRVFYGLAMQSGVSDAIIARMNTEVVKALAEPKVVEAIVNRFLEPDPQSVADFTVFLKQERERAGQLVKKYNVPRQ
ncbi:MAG: Bug family tripartite tricarboxylate transporter substrate binding protein [Burkholderiales bacterium]